MGDSKPLAKKWTVLSEQTVFHGSPFVTVRRQRILTDQGREVSNYYKVDLADFVICCPFTADGRVITIWQNKHGSGRHGLTFPAGIMEKGEVPEVAMPRELLEETGYEAKRVLLAGRYAVNGNQGCGSAHILQVEGCKKVTEPDAGDLENMDICLMAVDEIDRAFKDGKVSLLAHAAVWALVKSSERGT